MAPFRGSYDRCMRLNFVSFQALPQGIEKHPKFETKTFRGEKPSAGARGLAARSMRALVAQTSVRREPLRLNNEQCGQLSGNRMTPFDTLNSLSRAPLRRVALLRPTRTSCHAFDRVYMYWKSRLRRRGCRCAFAQHAEAAGIYWKSRLRGNEAIRQQLHTVVFGNNRHISHPSRTHRNAMIAPIIV